MKLPDGIKIVIPSYRRSDSIQRQTLRFLERMKVDPEDVKIYMADGDEFMTYKSALPERWRGCLKLGVPKVNSVRNLIQRNHSVGTKLIYMDDDIRDLRVRTPGITMKTPRKKQDHPITPVEFRQMMQRGFRECAKHTTFIWGVYPTSNPMHMRDRTFVGLAYVVAAFFGMVVRHDPDTFTKYPVKEDHERTLRYFNKDGAIVRLENIGLVTTYFGGKGGLHDTGVEVRHKWANQYIDKLLVEFPRYCKELQRAKYRDIRLLRLKPLDPILL